MKLEKTSEFHKLQFRREWGNHIYSVDGRKISNLKTVEIAGRGYYVDRRMVTEWYDDMGHRYPCTSAHFFVQPNSEEFPYIWVDLAEFLEEFWDAEEEVYVSREVICPIKWEVCDD